jgi:hypothetical protein
MPQTSDAPRILSTKYVLIRMALRVALLAAFAAFGSQAFARTLASFLLFAAIFCALMGAMRREPISWHLLTHWDEAGIYLLAAYAAASLS